MCPSLLGWGTTYKLPLGLVNLALIFGAVTTCTGGGYRERHGGSRVLRSKPLIDLSGH